jgi:hypothetical protein
MNLMNELRNIRADWYEADGRVRAALVAGLVCAITLVTLYIYSI